jgi:hypothetical protein
MSENHEVAATDEVTTGNDRVDAVVRSLRSLDGRPAEEHVAVYEAAHHDLREALTGSDEPA